MVSKWVEGTPKYYRYPKYEGPPSEKERARDLKVVDKLMVYLGVYYLEGLVAELGVLHGILDSFVVCMDLVKVL